MSRSSDEFSTEELFSSFELTTVLSNQTGEICKYIEGLGEDYVLNVSEHDLTEYVTNKYSVEPVRLGAAVLSDSQEVNIDVSDDPLRMIRRGHGPIYVKG